MRKYLLGSKSEIVTDLSINSHQLKRTLMKDDI